MSEFFHSVTLDRDLCHGCINCVKRCPTEAIRVRDGKAKILSDRCIDCGECIRICPHHAKKPIFDPLSVMDQYEYTVALPAPSLYGQFNNLDDVEIILRALIDMGFDDIFEVSRQRSWSATPPAKCSAKGAAPPGYQLCLSGGGAADQSPLSGSNPPYSAAAGASGGGRAVSQKRGNGAHWPSG